MLQIESNCFNGLELVEATSHNSSHRNAPFYPFSVWFDGSNRRYFPRDIREVLSLDHDIPSKYFATRARGASEHDPGSQPHLVLGRKMGSDIVIKSSNTITLFPQAISVCMGITYHTTNEQFKVFDTDDPSSISGQ